MYTTLSVVTQPAIEPVTIEQARQHCRIDSDYDDGLLAAYITTARAIAENYLNRALITQTLQMVLAQRPASPGMWPYVAAGPVFVLPLWFNGQTCPGNGLISRARQHKALSALLLARGAAQT